jgi:hypothetical protein
VQTILPTLLPDIVMTIAKTAGTVLIAVGLLAEAAAVPAAPPSTGLTAAFAPASPTVGVTEVTITGTASAGAKVIDTSTFPDGSVHIFTVKADAAGVYTDGPFVLQQLGTYHDVVRDDSTGATTAISYSGTGDFRIAVDPAAATITTAEGDFSIGVDPTHATMRAGLEARLKVTFASVGGFGGEVVPRLPASSQIPGAAVTWSSPRLKVPPNGSATAVLTILTLVGTTPGTYPIAPQGTSGSVMHALEPAIGLTITPPPPGTITAMFSPDRPIVGVTEVRIQGRASPGQLVVDTSTLPDGVRHDFVVPVTGAGTYSDGPFLLRQLGTYHDVLLDGFTGAKIELSYQGVGDFSAAVDQTSQTVARGQEAKFRVTFKSLSGFAGAITPAVPDLSKIPGATASWSQPFVTVRSGDSIAAGLTIKTSTATPAGTYSVTVAGTNGSVTRASDISLTVK